MPQYPIRVMNKTYWSHWSGWVLCCKQGRALKAPSLSQSFWIYVPKIAPKVYCYKESTDVDTQLLFGRHPVPRRQAYIYIYIFTIISIYIYIIVNTHVFRWCGIISWPGVTALQTKPIACQPTISQTSLLGRRPAVRRKPLNPGAGHEASPCPCRRLSVVTEGDRRCRPCCRTIPGSPYRTPEPLRPTLFSVFCACGVKKTLVFTWFWAPGDPRRKNGDLKIVSK